jgi:hypothetical protein
VSLSWRKEVRIALTPEGVALARLSKGLRRKLIDTALIPCSSSDPTDWRPCIEALGEALQAAAWQQARATVIVSNHFVRYALVPWSEHLGDDAEKEAWVRHQFRELYDESDAPLDYRWSEEGPSEPCVASAVEREFLERIERTLEQASLDLVSLQPYLMAVFNRWRRRLGARPVRLVLPEEGRVCMAAFADRSWRGITCRSAGADWQAELPLLLERELVLAADDAPPHVLLYCPQLSAAECAVLRDLPLEVLEPRGLRGYAASPGTPCAMALAGVI